DPEKRAAYDQLGSNWRAGQEFRPPPDWARNFQSGGGFSGEDGGFSDFFSSLFGQRGFTRGGPGGGFARAGEDHVATIEVDLEDAYRGGSRTIELSDGRGASRTLKVN